MKDSLVLPVHLGQTVYVSGYSFIVADVWTDRPYNTMLGRQGDAKAVYFRGFCTADKRNDSIRHTSYNGGVYGLGLVVSEAVEAAKAAERARYAKAYEVAQAGGMNRTDSHEFAVDQSTRAIAS